MLSSRHTTAKQPSSRQTSRFSLSCGPGRIVPKQRGQEASSLCSFPDE
ncbi:hypothetical protein CSHISOI_05783 [Colletotrichum shisoi]|uniref:Uncharacterized protein n=1 Tax=Colletotrichum shisoi TaxID=2078593 RepID=A0A5Q4BRN4_9PEZI|nr:hypothetical protein CSHISOI_05783 [Colletotrichum shisoi]